MSSPIAFGPGYAITASGGTGGGAGSVNFSAGTTSNNLASVVFSNSNGVTFGLNGSTITATVAAAGSINLSAGTTSQNLTNFVMSNSNRVSFGLAGSTITAQHALNFSGGTTSQNISDQLIFSNSNNVSFGLAGSTLTGTVTVASTQGSVNLSAGTTSNLSASFIFSNSNRVSFGLNAGTITAQHALNFSGGTTSNNISDQLIFSNSNNVSFGLAGSTLTGTVTVASTQGSINLSAGTTSNLASAFTFSNSNNVSFGLNASTITASIATSLTNINVSAGTTSNNLSALTFSNSNGITFGLNGSTITASIATSLSVVNFSAGTTSGNLGSVVFSDSNLVSWGLNGSTITANKFLNFSAGTTSNNVSSQIVFSNSNAFSFGLNGSTITGGQGFPLSTYEPYRNMGFSTTGGTIAAATTAFISVFPFVVAAPVSAGILNMMFSVNFSTLGTSSGQQSYGMAMGISTRNGSTLSSILSNSVSWGITGNNSTYSINQVTATSYTGFGATAQTSSGGSNISSQYTGMKMIQWPINSLLTPGAYWLGFMATASSSSVTCGLVMTYVGAAIASGLGVFSAAPMGSLSSAYSTGYDPFGGRWHVGHGVWSSTNSGTNVPVSINFASISANTAVSAFPILKFWRT